MKNVLLSVLVLFGCAKKDDSDQPAKPEGAPYAVIQGKNGLKYHTGLLTQEKGSPKFGSSHVRFTDCGALPASFDLRTLGLVPDVKDQGQCGSCWSFSKTGSLESALLGVGKALNLSEQEMVSCDAEQWGCEGGLLSDFRYQIKHGQSLESAFPYTSGNTGSNGACKQAPVAAQGVSFQYVGSASRGPTEEELKCALYTSKTIPWITVGATNNWGNPPSSEKTAYTSCSRSQTNHAVGVVGWWTDSRGKTQFIMKNSWGKNWGDKGYMSLALGCDSFGEEVGFIEVAKPAPTPTPVPPSPTPPGPSPTPGPCAPSKLNLPAEVQSLGGVEIMIGVKAEPGVAYSWSVDGKVVGTESMLYVVPPKDGVYKLTATNACSVVESQVRVRLVFSAK